jgi:hypothetical protein
MACPLSWNIFCDERDLSCAECRRTAGPLGLGRNKRLTAPCTDDRLHRLCRLHDVCIHMQRERRTSHTLMAGSKCFGIINESIAYSGSSPSQTRAHPKADKSLRQEKFDLVCHKYRLGRLFTFLCHCIVHVGTTRKIFSPSLYFSKFSSVPVNN